MDLNAFRNVLNQPSFQEQLETEARFRPRPRPGYDFNRGMPPMNFGGQLAPYTQQEAGALMRENMLNNLGQLNQRSMSSQDNIKDFQNLLNKLEGTSGTLDEYGMRGQRYRNMGQSLNLY
jgi:hypothetical protein